MSESVDLAPQVITALCALCDAGEIPLRCNKGPIRTAVAAAVRALNDDNLGPNVRPWDLSALRRRAAEITDQVRLIPETTREITLADFSPDAVLTALGVAEPDDVELDVDSEDLGQGQSETRYRYLFTDNGRSVLAEEVKNEIFDGATPCSRYLRGVLIDGGRGALVTASRDGAVLTQG